MTTDEQLVAAVAERRWRVVNELLAPTVEAARAGDAAAVEALVAAVHRHALARPVVAGLLSGEEDIDDAEQLTLIAVARGIERFRGDAAFTTWLFTVARNEAKQVIRSKSRHEGHAPIEDAVGATAFARRISTVVADQVGLHELLATLPEQHAEVLRLRDLEGRSYEEVASELGVPIGTVRSRLSRARAALGELLRDWQR